MRVRGVNFFSEIFEYREKIFQERVNLIVDEYNCFLCGRKIKKSEDITRIAASEASPRHIAIGTERTNKIAKTIPKMIPGSNLLYYYLISSRVL